MSKRALEVSAEEARNEVEEFERRLAKAQRTDEGPPIVVDAGTAEARPVLPLVDDFPQETIIEVLGRLDIAHLFKYVDLNPIYAQTPDGISLLQTAWHVFTRRDFRRPYGNHPVYRWVTHFEQLLGNPAGPLPLSSIYTIAVNEWSKKRGSGAGAARYSYQSRFEHALRGEKLAVLTDAIKNNPAIARAHRYRHAWRRVYGICSKITRMLVTWAVSSFDYDILLSLPRTIAANSTDERIAAELLKLVPADALARLPYRYNVFNFRPNENSTPPTGVATFPGLETVNRKTWFSSSDARSITFEREELTPDILDAIAAATAAKVTPFTRVGHRFVEFPVPDDRPAAIEFRTKRSHGDAIVATARPGTADMMRAGANNEEPPVMTLSFASWIVLSNYFDEELDEGGSNYLKTVKMSYDRPDIRIQRLDLEQYMRLALPDPLPVPYTTRLWYFMDVSYPGSYKLIGDDMDLPHRRAFNEALDAEYSATHHQTQVLQQRPGREFPLLHALAFALSPTMADYMALPGDTTMADFLGEAEVGAGGPPATPFVVFREDMS